MTQSQAGNRDRKFASSSSWLMFAIFARSRTHLLWCGVCLCVLCMHLRTNEIDFIHLLIYYMLTKTLHYRFALSRNAREFPVNFVVVVCVECWDDSKALKMKCLVSCGWRWWRLSVWDCKDHSEVSHLHRRISSLRAPIDKCVAMVRTPFRRWGQFNYLMMMANRHPLLRDT